MLKIFLETIQLFRKSQTPERTQDSLSKELRAPRAPVFLTKLPVEIILNYNDKLILSAEVSALPNADFLWSVNGNAIELLNSFKLLNELNRSTLVVNPPVCIGKYNVTATNTLGSVINDNDTNVRYSTDNIIVGESIQSDVPSEGK